jgi:hypothetical protein
LRKILGSIAKVGLEKAETLALKPVVVFPAPVKFILQARLGIKVNIAVVGVRNVFFLTGSKGKPASGLPVFRFIFAAQKPDGNVNRLATIVSLATFEVV